MKIQAKQQGQKNPEHKCSRVSLAWRLHATSCVLGKDTLKAYFNKIHDQTTGVSFRRKCNKSGDRRCLSSVPIRSFKTLPVKLQIQMTS